MRRFIKYVLVLLLAGFAIYKSVYFEKLSTRVKSSAAIVFNAAEYCNQLWSEKLPARLDSAISLSDFIVAMQSDPQKAINEHSNLLGIGNFRYCLVKCTGSVKSVEEDEVLLTVLQADSQLVLHLATEFIYGNAVRDASGLVRIIDFSNTKDLNDISEELNRRIRSEVVPSFRKSVKKGDKVEVVGAIRFNRSHLSWTDLEIIPLRIRTSS